MSSDDAVIDQDGYSFEIVSKATLSFVIFITCFFALKLIDPDFNSRFSMSVFLGLLAGIFDVRNWPKLAFILTLFFVNPNLL